MLSREELVEQSYFFHILGERSRQHMASQEVLASIKEEVLATTNLPKALDFLASELRLNGVLAPGMAKLSHYFTSFQTFVIAESEDERGKFDLNVGLVILEREAKFRAEKPTPQAVFLFQFESISRNRLNYDRGLKAVAEDPVFDQDWRKWILTFRRQIGLVDVADMIYVRSEYYHMRRAQMGLPESEEPQSKPLFGEKEGRIALANRKKDPLLLFAALQRQLGYPEVPRPKPVDNSGEVLAQLVRRMERLEQRLKLVEEEQKGGINIERFYGTSEKVPSPEDFLK